MTSAVAEATFLPLGAVADAAPTKTYAHSNGAALRALETAVSVQMKVTIPKPRDRRKKARTD